MAVKDVSYFLEGGKVGVLLIHGLTGTPMEMSYLAKGLHREGYSVYGMQLPGHCGTEEDLLATGLADWCAAVERALDELRARVSKVFVGGLSMGAVLALDLAAKRPEAVDGLLLYGPTLWYDGWTVPWYSFLLKLLIDTPIGRRYRFVEKFPYGLKDERLRAIVVKAMFSGSSTESGLSGMPSQSLRDMWKLSARVKRQIGTIKAPTLIQHAREDDISSVKNSFYIVQHLQGPAELVLLHDSYHLVTIDRERGKVVSRSVDYLRRWSGLGQGAAKTSVAVAG